MPAPPPTPTAMRRCAKSSARGCTSPRWTAAGSPCPYDRPLPRPLHQRARLGRRQDQHHRCHRAQPRPRGPARAGVQDRARFPRPHPAGARQRRPGLPARPLHGRLRPLPGPAGPRSARGRPDPGRRRDGPVRRRSEQCRPGRRLRPAAGLRDRRLGHGPDLCRHRHGPGALPARAAALRRDRQPHRQRRAWPHARRGPAGRSAADRRAALRPGARPARTPPRPGAGRRAAAAR
mmetsp:Transcript_26206/g.61812  ORF Transcript_26206/g.61812 Transcript_26206/m.61812 type:complete len:234 (+) Transcript_26206:164-865(+)